MSRADVENAYRHVMEAIGVLGHVEWAGIDPGFDESSSRRTPPYAVWRYDNETEDAGSRIRSAVALYDGAVAWSVEKPRRNWIIKPAHVTEYGRTTGLDGRELLNKISASDPQFCEDAIRDFILLFAYLKSNWSSRRSPDQ
ncbi:hypothetical protein [Nocardia sp. NPDC049707]|uniref:hypothetical protein n=1 Tax=Nocardia sp. NPDC049707 TaxID=3154735 RepID=UPI003431CD53